MTEAEGLFWATAVGAALGVIAGTFVQAATSMIGAATVDRRQKTAFAKELGYNLQLVESLLGQTQRLRNAVNGRTLGSYVGFFNINTAFWSQTLALMTSGKLYAWLDLRALQTLQKANETLSVGTANYVNGEIEKRRQRALNEPDAFDQAEAVQFVDWLEDRFNATKQQLTEVAVSAGRDIKKLS